MKIVKSLDVFFWRVLAFLISKGGIAVVVFVLFGIFFVFRSPQDYVDIGRIEQRNDGLIYRISEKVPLTGVVIEKHENGKPESEIEYQNGKAHGQSTQWWPNGQISAKVHFEHGEIIGKQSWDLNGNQLK